MNEEICGWYYYAPTKKWHYFDEGTSLCGWYFMFLKSQDLRIVSPEDSSSCKVCDRVWLREKKK